MKKKIKVNIDKIDDKYKPLAKEEMSYGELSLMGTVILKDKIANLKQRFSWKKLKKNSGKD